MKFDCLVLLVFTVSFLAHTCSAAPVEPEGGGSPPKQSEQVPGTHSQSKKPFIEGDRGIPPGFTCPQTILVNNNPVQIASLLADCHAHQELLELFHSTSEEFSAAIGNSRTTHVICGGFVSLVEDVNKRKELTSLCEEKVLDDVSLVGNYIII